MQAHIISYSGGRLDRLANALLLREDVHTLFDRHLIAIDTSSLKVIVAPEIKGRCSAVDLWDVQLDGLLL